MIDMELMTGGTLGDLLDSSQLQPALLLSYSTQMMNGLSFLHGVGIIHRDVTPRNILISSSNCLKIADFGLSHLMSGIEPRTPLVCSLYYRAPELLRVNAFVRDARSLVYTCAVDNWSVGCILREMIIGQGPEFKPARPTFSPTTSAIEQLDAIIRKFCPSSGFVNERLAMMFCDSCLKLPETVVSSQAPAWVIQMLEVTRLLLVPDPELRCTAETACKILGQLETT
ncbi:glycogen synthase kinase-3-like protein [Colletotrichum abscissum]|uniref:EKC/KEOPS complex subunit BUD32 n=1 Tax=Colletotrichum abscissum TaxID=1671311 RepID=A0A9P9WZU7_9PEZI|nr:glycogen synthase kinase-3-like protein [Colletotrichum abscissum]